MRMMINPVRVGEIITSTVCGDFKVIKIGHTLAEVRVKFINTGYERLTSNANARRGKVNDPYARLKYGIGYMGRERRHGQTNKKTHNAWATMLESYVSGGARVCSEWLNFTNFERWYEENNPDLKLFMVKNNNATVYCKQTVRIVTIKERNIEISKHRMGVFTLKNTKTGETIEANNGNEIARKTGMRRGAISHLKSGRYSHVGDWALVK